METIKIAWRLVVDIVTGLVLFVILTGGAVGAHRVAEWGERNGLDQIIVFELRFVEFTLAAADAISVTSLAYYALANFISRLRR